MAFGYHVTQRIDSTGDHAALYDPSSRVNTDYGIRAWIDGVVSADELVLALPSYGYMLGFLVNPEDNGIDAPTKGPAIMDA